MQNYAKAKDNGEHLSAMVSSLRVQLNESNADKRHLHYENTSLRARLDQIESGDRGKASHRSAVQEKDVAARESVHGRLSGHGMDGMDSTSQPHHLRSSDHSAAERNLVAAQVCLACISLSLANILK